VTSSARRFQQGRKGTLNPSPSHPAASVVAVAHRRRQCPNGSSELDLSITGAWRSFLARRRRRGTLASLAMVARNSGKVELVAAVAEMPNAPSPSLKRLNGEAEVREGLLVELLARVGARCYEQRGSR
jgi:hypothetical protein